MIELVIEKLDSDGNVIDVEPVRRFQLASEAEIARKNHQRSIVNPDRYRAALRTKETHDNE